MKRFIAGILFSAMILTTTVFASDIDLSNMDVEQLIDLKHTIDNELYEKQGFIDLPYGYYVVGKDIAPGDYVIKAYGEQAEDSSRFWQIILYKNEESKQEYYQAGSEYSLKYSEAIANADAGHEVKYPEPVDKYSYIMIDQYIHCPSECGITLEDGNVLYVGNGVLNENTKLVISKGAKKGLFME